MIRIRLDEPARAELRRLRRTDLPAAARTRLEVVLLSDAGWSPPRIAAHLGVHPHTARAALTGFAARGAAALYPDRPGPDPDHARRADVTGRLRDLLGLDRPPVGRRPPGGGRPPERPPGPPVPAAAGRRVPADGPDGRAQAGPGRGRVGHAGPRLPEKKVAARRLRLFYLDECGFAPSLPTSYSWCLPGRRKRVPYEHPRGRRVNALATYEPLGPEPRLDAVLFERTPTSQDLLAYLAERLPAAGVPRVVVLDNAGIHTSKAVKAARPALAKVGIYPYYLPAYSPELNRIEPVFKQVKHHDIPVRSYTTTADLRRAVEVGFDTFRQRLRPKCDIELRLAA
jgi:putative transposase